jgi:hypothetical protein
MQRESSSPTHLGATFIAIYKNFHLYQKNTPVSKQNDLIFFDDDYQQVAIKQ